MLEVFCTSNGNYIGKRLSAEKSYKVYLFRTKTHQYLLWTRCVSVAMKIFNLFLEKNKKIEKVEEYECCL